MQELIADDKANGGGGGGGGGGGAGLNWRGAGGGGGGFGGGGGGGGGYGGGGSKGAVDIPVPRACVGVVIGKNGDMIKKIQQESDARIQFKQDDQGEGGKNGKYNESTTVLENREICIYEKLEICEKTTAHFTNARTYSLLTASPYMFFLSLPHPPPSLSPSFPSSFSRCVTHSGTSPERLCTISGTSDSIQMATSIIQDLIAQAKARDGGRGPGRGGGGGGGGGGGSNWMGGGGGQMNGSGGEVQFPVPADKCGLVIGKGEEEGGGGEGEEEERWEEEEEEEEEKMKRKESKGK